MHKLLFILLPLLISASTASAWSPAFLGGLKSGTATQSDACAANPSDSDGADQLCEDWEGTGSLATWSETTGTPPSAGCATSGINRDATHANTLACTNKGSQALEIIYGDTEGAFNCYIRHTLSASVSTTKIDFWVNVREAGAMTSGQRSYFLIVYGSGSTSIWGSVNWVTDTTYKFQISYHNGSSSSNLTASSTYNEDEWHRITIVADTDADTIEYYVDGVSVASASNYATTYIPNRIQFGTAGTSFTMRANADFQIENVRWDDDTIPAACPQ